MSLKAMHPFSTKIFIWERQIVRRPFFFDTSYRATAARAEQLPLRRWAPNFAHVILVAVPSGLFRFLDFFWTKVDLID